ncbi:oxygenase MpaB family protein [Pseudonocardia sp.]|uniref:oxygenase MpaB family protein n=1 Tax=Pseudonocardia sp. TaxID=60912 RepID=UPI003D0B3BAA
MIAQVTGVHPRRFASAPGRNARIARPLGIVARVRAPDEELLDRIGRRMFTRDEPAARLAAAMGSEVTMGQFRRALAHGVDAGSPAVLREFFALVEDTPAWVAPDLVERGARAFRRLGRSRDDVLLQLSLIGGYRFEGPADLLVRTGGLTGSTAQRRLGETRIWGDAVSAAGGMRRDGEGWRLTVHVRLMHALVNRRFETNGRWDVARYGLPVNQADAAATLGLFNSTALLGVRLLGRVVTRAESLAIMHLWRYVGWLMGVDEDFLFDTEREQNVFNYHVVLAQAGPTPAGAQLAAALVDGQVALDHGRLGTLRGRYERLRTLSMLRWFLGARSLRELGLPVTPPWAIPPIVAANLARSVLARTGVGGRLLERRSARFVRRERAKLFGGAPERIGALPG